MRIGFSSLYSWRPHVEHLYFLANLVQEAGHSVSFLTCDSDLDTCYTKQLRPDRSNFMHCARCRVGGIRSYASKRVLSIGQLWREADRTVAHSAEEWCKSSASTLGRFESNEDYEGAEFLSLAEQLVGPTRKTYIAALEWIKRERLEAICVFNGRVEVTRAVTEAARASGIPFVAMERSWFGDGIQLLPGENCLGLQNVHRMMAAWKDAPLTREQALLAAAHISSRFLRRNKNEWRAYNTDAKPQAWPTTGRRRVLLIPGSRNEIWGQKDRTPQWSEPTVAFDALIEKLALQPADVVLRCHPNWGEFIAKRDGHKSEQYYSEWARSRGIHTVASTDKTSTLSLIEQSDAIVVNGGSAALEAGALGKQVIAMGPSIYQEAGFQNSAYDIGSLSGLILYADLEMAEREKIAEEIRQKTLRFAYTMNYRVPQFVRNVRCVTTTEYKYYEGADPRRLIDLLKSGVLRADDENSAVDDAEETLILKGMREHDWESLFCKEPSSPLGQQSDVYRRWLYRGVDRIRAALPRGDL